MKSYFFIAMLILGILPLAHAQTAPNSMTEKGTATKSSNAKYKANVDAYNTWMENNKNKVGLDHDYTHLGLNALVGAVKSIYKASDIEIEKFDVAKALVVDCADKLKHDRYSDTHADWTRQAFDNLAEMLEAIQSNGNFPYSKDAVADVKAAAGKINPDKLLTRQAEHIYNFFEKAQIAVNSLSKNISWASTE